jgi:YebC/PmpR family DNA-binding regulatory protein
MGRAFEYRKNTKMKRWSAMSKAFTKIGKQITIAVKAAGPDPDSNLKLRTAIQNGRACNMPKDNIDAAIKRAANRDEKEMDEVVYEGYGPNGIPMMIECATDNTNRTVANLRAYFTRGGGAIGTSGSVGFMFERKGVFVLQGTGLNAEELELELIDFGAESVTADEDGEITVISEFTEFGAMQKALEDMKLTILSSQLQRIPTTYNEDLTEEQADEVFELIEKLEEDDDVQAVFHNLR